MKKLAISLLLIFYALLCHHAYAQYESGHRVIFKERHEGDLYVVANKIIVESAITGDLIAASQTLEIRDSILGDLTAAGAYINQWGYVGDDMRCAGGKIDITGHIGDDLLVFGGDITINDSSIINGDLVAYGGNVFSAGLINGNVQVGAGQLFLEGHIKGSLEFEGEQIELNGIIEQDVKLIANEINLGNNVSIGGNLEYWTPDGEININLELVKGTITYNPDLRPANASNFPAGWLMGLISLSIYIPAVLLIILFINYFFGKYLQKTAPTAKNQFAKSLGFGILYLLAVPTVIIVLFSIIIGIPLSLFLLFAYAFSLLFGHVVASLLLMYYFKNKGQKNWGYWSGSFYALAILLLIRLFTLVPILGWIGSVLIIAVTYGSILLTFKRPNEGSY